MAEDRAPGKVPVVVLGATGYVAGELLRLLAGHPRFELAAAVSRSRADTLVAETFPNLASAYPDTRFAPDESAALDSHPALGLFAALPHAETAARVASVMSRAEELGRDLRVVDLSADFRLADPAVYERTYGVAHPAPALLERFRCAPPELLARDRLPATCVAQPGCFTTAVTLACAPLLASGLARRFQVSAITGSTGSGREPKPGTHHPERHSNLYSYQVLRHRHQPEMEQILEETCGTRPALSFVPHSGPFARGIHATVFAALEKTVPEKELRAVIGEYYAKAPFVRVGEGEPKLKDVVGTHECRLGVRADGSTAVVLSVIDNLTKGAAGGALHWMNRLWGFPETEGLKLCAPAWI